ncbi:YcxB family protein [Hydrogenimonas cancrithermarum]|uniref:YcxB-like C-terminal domain-containing protein n=1 Tax=Hydrogenimonas cancrithermarum TaxID=2993563 RepID=A0ABN6WWX9_9BACT|nr:hypothetical protein [Hydrogenimonas cancrithermarum]BDY13676.1 hypothetical protein HCR_19880 [Hydrogenimonas cancrithermarum]
MSESLKLHWDEATFLEGARLAYTYQMRHTWRRYAGWVFIALTQFGVVGAVSHGAPGLLLVSTLLLLYWYGLRWPLRKAALRRFFEKSPFAGETLHIVAEEEGLCINQRCVPWPEFKRVLAAKEGYLLDMEDSFLYIPKNRFENSDTREAFSSLLRNSVEQFQKVEL